MKISIAASRVLTSLSVVAALSSSAIAAADTVNKNTDFTTKFKENKTGNWEYKNTANDLTLSVDPTSVTTGSGTDIKPIELNKLTINANSFTGDVAVTLGGAENPLNPKDPLADTYSFNIDTKGNVTQNGATNVYHNSSIKSSEGAVTFGDAVKVEGANLDITSKTGTAFNGVLNALTISNKGNVNVTGDANLGSGAVTIESGKLNVTGKLTSTNNNFTFGSLDNSWNNNNQGIYAKGDVTLNNGTLNIQSSDLPLGQLNLITSGGKITNTATLGSVSFAQDVSEYLSNQSLLAPYLNTGNYNLAIDAKTQYAAYLDYQLKTSTDNKTLYVDGQLTDAFKNAFNKNQDFTNLKGLATNLVNAESTNIDSALKKLTDTTTNPGRDIGVKGQVADQIESFRQKKIAAEDTIKAAEADKATAEKELSAAKDDAAKKTAQGKIDAANATITAKQKELNQITSELNVANAELKAIEAAIKDLDARNTEFNKLKTEITALADGTTDAEKAKKLNELKNLMLEALAPSINTGDYSLANSILEAVKTRTDYTILGGIVLGGMNDTLTPIVSATKASGNTGESLGILSSIASSNIHNQQVMQVITNQRFFKDTRDAARSATNFTDASSSAMTAVNVSNDMAIGSRIARANNPFQSLSKERFASIQSDAPYKYYETYNAAVWANAFGGANIIDGESGGVYGISVGADSNLTDNVLIGAYFTYANAELQDKLLKQDSDNFQLGIYSQIKIAPTWELNLKAYGQLGKTDQDVTSIAGINTSDFNQKFFGLSANVGKVFDFSNSWFVKPFAGVNYYYSYTPDYTERGSILAQSVQSNTNNSVSLEAGLESRKYFSESSYLFITPKIEQYVINNGDDYVGRFAGSTTSFRIASAEKKKTYGQLIVGGNIAINDSLSLNAGIGAKQILAGKVDSKNETYINGNIGLKYRF
ncbi:autotransporter domain-containing protein [Helicobacter colisuis]|uniref:autotransporter family protein n=1 Tax=Helicobacter colisuis TaxID=2949739 RepID=UPI002029BABF|nr:autotransporter domain-containing protein [Helicobacter colisuis]MCL9823134.1 autotransporter domain-containing protein [Helicobacter colisuis]